MSRFTHRLIASIAAALMASQVASAQKKPTPTPTPKPAAQTNQPKPTASVTNAPKTQTQPLVTTRKVQPTPITPTSHPQSTIAVSPSVPQALPTPVTRMNNGLPPNIPKTTIAPVPPAVQQSELLAQLKQALRVQQFHQDKLYYTIVCGPGTVCPQPSFNPNQSIPSPNEGIGVEQYRYQIQVENRIDQQAQQIIAQQGTTGAQNTINAIRRRYDPTYH